MINNACTKCSVDSEPLYESANSVSYLTGGELRNHTHDKNGNNIAIDYPIKFCPECGRELNSATELTSEESTAKSWAQMEVELAIKKNGCGCVLARYESALRVFESLCKDCKDIFSVNATKNVLNRLIDHRPLTPIEDTADAWSDIMDRNDDKGYVCYQCNRLSSLFKYVYNDGTIKYKDVDNNIAINIDSRISYHSGLIQEIVDELWAVTMPYSPGKRIEVYCEEFLYDCKNGDFDTVGVFYALDPNGEKVTLNRFYKESKDDWKKISRFEYMCRKARKKERL